METLVGLESRNPYNNEFIADYSQHDDDEVEKMNRKFSTLKAGDPKEVDTDIGTLARPDLVEALNDQVERSLEQDARRIAGTDVDSEGAYFPPTILLDVTSDMPAFREELFGPVAPIIRASSDEEAVRLANESEFGLVSASLLTLRHYRCLIEFGSRV